ncbi:MAG: glycosyltransferase family 2 protein [Candidatus Scalindua sp.]|nr:glycosyltransferase family 2 protein [Candidatus Scalindua sp.]
MEIIFEHKNPTPPKISIVLLDWNCRESFHIFDYLSNQTVSRDQYEVIWIEYYNRRVQEIEVRLKECESQGKPPIVDQWIVMGIPDTVYYHKHLMYNLGIVASRGKIISLCDSDAIVTPTFVESIVSSFDKDPDIVLHLDEVRNVDKRFYPFNYPSLDEILKKGCINWKEGKTTGLLDKDDQLHTRNYGACMCAQREDLIHIGGADEHIDYLGHVCGPYEMTFRLVNSGKREIWHQEEFLYHVWHPGTDGKGNYCGPHDGQNMSTTALNGRLTCRVMPLVENPAITALRLNEDDIIYKPLLLQAIPEENISDWEIEKLSQHKQSSFMLENFFKQPVITLRLLITSLKMLIKQFHMKATTFSRQPKSLKDILRKVCKIYDFLRNMNKYNTYVIERCRCCLQEMTSKDVKEFAAYGTKDVVGILYKLTLSAPIKINLVFDKLEGRSFFGLNVMPIEAVKDYKGKIVVATLVGVDEIVQLLKSMGVDENRIILL